MHLKRSSGKWLPSCLGLDVLIGGPYDDVIKWKHFPRYWPFVRGIHRSLVISPHKGQWRGTLMFSFICAWMNGWVNNRNAGDLRRHRAHYGVTVMYVLNWMHGCNNPLASFSFAWFVERRELKAIAVTDKIAHDSEECGKLHNLLLILDHHSKTEFAVNLTFLNIRRFPHHYVLTEIFSWLNQP